jgi:hypothetical protein
VDLIFPVLDEEREMRIQLDQFHSIMHVFDWSLIENESNKIQVWVL